MATNTTKKCNTFNCGCKPMWTAYYSHNLGIFLFPETIKIPGKLTTFDGGVVGCQINKVLRDADGDIHYYQNHQDDLEPYRFCFFHLKMLQMHMVPSGGMVYFPYGITCESISTVKSSACLKMRNPQQTMRQKLFKCCELSSKHQADSVANGDNLAVGASFANI